MKLFFLFYIMLICFGCTPSEQKVTASPKGVLSSLKPTIEKNDTIPKNDSTGRAVNVIDTTTKHFNKSRLPQIVRQQFTINPNKDTILIGKEGSVFLIPKNSFIDKTGKTVTKSVQFTLLEAYQLEDMLLNNLQTISANGLLITSGMFSLTATNETGEQLQIATDKSIYFQTKNKVRSKDKLYTLENGIWTNPKAPTNYLTYKPFDFYPTQSRFDECFVLLQVHIKKMKDEIIQNQIPQSYIFSQDFFSRYNQIVCGTIPTPSDLISIYLNNLDKPLVEVDKLILAYIKKHPQDGARKQKAIALSEMFIAENKTTFPPGFNFPQISYQDFIKPVDVTKLPFKFDKISSLYKLGVLGWCNLDTAFPNQKLQQQTIQVKTNQAVKFLYLVGNNQAVSLNATDIDNTPPYEHTFKVRLPTGVAFHILAVNEQNGAINYAQKLITTNGNNKEALILKPIKNSTFSKAMQDIQANWQVAE